MIIQATFLGTEKAEDLYSFVRSTLRYTEEPFYLCMFITQTSNFLPVTNINYVDIAPPVKRISPQGGRLSLDLQFTHRILVNFSWDNGASGNALTEPPLNDAYLAQAKAIKVEKKQLEAAVEGGEDEEEEEEGKGKGKGKKKAPGGGGASGSGGGGKLPKWLKLGKN